MKIKLYKNDLPANIKFSKSVAIDTETMGLNHLRDRKDVQNIDLMNLAGFCRNCLSKWFREEAQKKGIEISDPEARKHVYGMSYDEWKRKYQK